MSIAENVNVINDRIAAAARRAGRDPALVRLVAVSKTQPASVVEEAARAGQSLFGENYVQEFATKAAQVAAPVEWHFIGSPQTNKVRQIAGLVTLIHSVDRLSLAQEIDRLVGVDSVALDKDSRRLDIAYDASHLRIEQLEEIVRKHGTDLDHGWWTQFKEGWYRFSDRNLRDNILHEPWSSTKLPPRR